MKIQVKIKKSVKEDFLKEKDGDLFEYEEVWLDKLQNLVGEWVDVDASGLNSFITIGFGEELSIIHSQVEDIKFLNGGFLHFQEELENIFGVKCSLDFIKAIQDGWYDKCYNHCCNYAQELKANNSNETEIAEELANHFEHDEWLDDELSFIWDLSLKVFDELDEIIKIQSDKS